RNNVFSKNEMDAISCWMNNTDRIERNTIAANLREGIAVCGDAKPTIRANIVASNPVGVAGSQIAEKGAGIGNPQLNVEGNWFWKNDVTLKRIQDVQPLPEGNTQADPKFVNEAASDYSLAANSAARDVGAEKAPSLQSPWQLQPEEKAIIPATDT